MVSVFKSLIGTFTSIFLELKVYLIFLSPLVCGNSALCEDSALARQVTPVSHTKLSQLCIFHKEHCNRPHYKQQCSGLTAMCNFLYRIKVIFFSSPNSEAPYIKLLFDIPTDFCLYESTKQKKSLKVSSSRDYIKSKMIIVKVISSYLLRCFGHSLTCPDFFSCFLTSRFESSRKFIFLLSSSFDLIFASSHCHNPCIVLVIPSFLYCLTFLGDFLVSYIMSF